METYTQQANDFATKHGIKLTVLSNRIGSMSWDKDGEERRIFNLQLERNNKKYTFEFGQSINKSFKTKIVPITETVDEIEVFAGLSTKSASASAKFILYKSNDFAISDELLSELTAKMREEFTNELSGKNKSLHERFKNGKISKDFLNRNLIDNGINEGAFYKCVQNAIKRELMKKVEVQGESLLIEPTFYDVLTSLQKYDVNTFENFCGDFGYDTDSRTAERTYKAVKKEFKAVERLFGDILEELQEIQ